MRRRLQLFTGFFVAVLCGWSVWASVRPKLVNGNFLELKKIPKRNQAYSFSIPKGDTVYQVDTITLENKLHIWWVLAPSKQRYTIRLPAKVEIVGSDSDWTIFQFENGRYVFVFFDYLAVPDDISKIQSF